LPFGPDISIFLAAGLIIIITISSLLLLLLRSFGRTRLRRGRCHRSLAKKFWAGGRAGMWGRAIKKRSLQKARGFGLFSGALLFSRVVPRLVGCMQRAVTCSHTRHGTADVRLLLSGGNPLLARLLVAL